jgi:hypothetical protein
MEKLRILFIKLLKTMKKGAPIWERLPIERLYDSLYNPAFYRISTAKAGISHCSLLPIAFLLAEQTQHTILKNNITLQHQFHEEIPQPLPHPENNGTADEEPVLHASPAAPAPIHRNALAEHHPGLRRPFQQKRNSHHEMHQEQDACPRRDDNKNESK